MLHFACTMTLPGDNKFSLDSDDDADLLALIDNINGADLIILAESIATHGIKRKSIGDYGPLAKRLALEFHHLIIVILNSFPNALKFPFSNNARLARGNF